MKRRFQTWLGVCLLVFVGGVYLWQNPGVYQGGMKAAEIEAAMREIDKLPFPPEERVELLKRARRWMETDDGKPVYMLNLMRFYPQLRQYPGAIAFHGTPLQSNALYESVVIPQLMKLGGYPLYAGVSRGGNLLEHSPELDNWDRVLVVRYPNRKAFVSLVSSPTYREVAPYKLMALKVVLTPTTLELQMPDLTLLAAGLALVLFLGVGWWRACAKA